jgi:peptidoglycan/xylan/chitin deacetylase (PgdA/CDA1 family)
MTLTATQEPYPTPTASAIPTPTWTAVPTLEPPTVTPTAVDPAQAQIRSYAAFTVQQGQDLALIAELGGSDAALIAQYNRLVGPPQPGQALIIPQLAGRTSQLQNPPTLIERGPSTQPWVALTLDAGASSAPTPAMLDALRSRGIQITFFLTGKWIRENPDLTRQIVADGHEVANHTTNHPDLRKLDDAAIRQELDDTEAALRETAGVSSKPFFRPPFGAYDQRVLRVVQAEGYLPIYWTLDSLDSVGEPKSAEFLLQRVTTKLTPEKLRGAIILAHCGNQSTADALPAILDRFSAMGFEVHTLSEVLAAQ